MSARRHLPHLLVATALFISVGSMGAQAQVASPIVKPDPALAAKSAGSFTPMEKRLSVLRKVALPPLDTALETKTPPQVVPGSVGGAAVKSEAKADAGGDIAPQNYGTGSFNTINHYTDRLAQLTSSYPNRVTGWLTFVNYANQNFRCSASLISRSIVLTAGHCVHKGGGGSPYWNKSAVFTPAYANGAAPYGSANAIQFWTTSGWFNTGALDQGYDVALVVLGKRTGTLVEIGNYTGWYGFCVTNCLQQYWYLTQLGYPGNYYSGAYMAEGQHIEYSDSKDYRSGSGMEGGSSGGPHVANIGSLSNSSTAGLWPYRNIAFAATSWGYVDPQWKIQGYSSTSGPANANNFKAIYNGACTRARLVHGAGSCSLLP